MNLRVEAALVALVLLAPACTDKGEVGPLLTVAPEFLDFGTVPVDSRSERAFRLDNDGSTSFELLSVSLDEGDAGSWNIDWSGSLTLEPGDGAEVTVTFAPEEEGEALGQILVRTSLDDPTRTVALSGTGGLSETDADGDGFSPATGDCDDSRADVFPGAEELCDGLDNDCSGAPGPDEADADSDGVRVCGGDCDDSDPDRRPGNEEVCDGKDNDCDGIVQDDRDDDDDGYTLCTGDCDDADDSAYPTAEEVCDYVDNDCSGGVDDIDEDGDGFSACPSGGDCDDDNGTAYPVLVDAAAGDGGDGTVDAPFATVAAAMSGLDGQCNTIMVRAGTYTADIDVTGGTLTVAGTEADRDTVVLQAPKGDRVLDARGGAVVTLRDLTVTGGAASEDGGALRATSATLDLSNVLLTGNTTGGDGGAIAVSSGTLRLADCTFLENAAGDDGGAVAALSSSVDDHGSRYDTNQGARGGAVVWEASSGTLADARFVDNDASFDGGALWLVGGSGILVERVELWNNVAAGAGGAVAITDLSDEGSILRNLWVEANVAGEEGGGIAVSGSRSALVIANSDFLGNDAGSSGGGLWLGADDADGTWAWSNLVCWNGGDDGLSARAGAGASVAWNTGYNNLSLVDFDLDAGEDGGENESADPRFADYDPGDAPADHDLDLSSSSPAVDSGPSFGGPSSVTTWQDRDGSRNDRGLTGGQGASP